MALLLSRVNRRPLTSPYRIHQLISQSSPLSTVSPGNDNTSSTAAADSQRQGLSFEDIYHRKVQDGSGQIGFQSLKEELESLRTSNTNNAKGGSTFPWSINGSKISKSPFSDLRNSIQKLSESANEKKRGPTTTIVGSYNRGVQDGSAQIGFGTVKESLKSLRTTINADNAKGDSTSPWSSRGRNVDAYSAMLKGMEFYPNVDLRQCLLYLGVDYKSLMPSQSTPDYALHPPKDEFVERYFHTFKLMEKQGTELDSARVEAILRSKWACKELQVPENFILNFDDRHVIEFRDEETKTLYSMEIGETELWPEAVVDFLLDTMIEEMKNGVSFTSPSSRCPRWMGWENIKNALNDKFNKAYTKEHVCNKYCVLRTKYCDFKNLLLHTGMSYNASTGQVTADEKVWSLAARDSGKAVKQFREKGCPEYPKLCSLFEDTSATEASAKTSMRTLSDDGHEGKVNDVQQNEVKDEISVDSANVKKVSKTAEAKMKGKLTAPVRKKLETEISRDSDDAKEVSKTAEGKMKCKVTAHARKKSETVESLLDCMALLQDMEIKDAEFTRALDILRTIIDFRSCFLRMNDKRRLGWVRNLDIVKRD